MHNNLEITLFLFTLEESNPNLNTLVHATGIGKYFTWLLLGFEF